MPWWVSCRLQRFDVKDCAATDTLSCTTFVGAAMKKNKNEKALLKEALRMVMDDAVRRGIAEFEPTDSASLKIEYAYRLLVHDKAIIPLPEQQRTLPNMKHRLAMWVSHELPPDHKLLK